MHLTVIAEQLISSADVARVAPVARAVLVVSGDRAVQVASVVPAVLEDLAALAAWVVSENPVVLGAWGNPVVQVA